MLYFSEIKGKKVYTEDDVYVGRLSDMVFHVAETPKITKLVIKTNGTKPTFMVSTQSLIKIDGKVFLNKNYSSSKLVQNELYLGKNLLDTQIIDIAGSKIIRVNDVVIAEKPEYHIAGVDIGMLGILRWFRIEEVANKFLGLFNRRLTSKFLSWGDIQPLELGSGQVKIKKEQKRLEKIRPEDLADYLEKTNVMNVRKILNILDEKKAAEVIEELNIGYQTALFKTFTSEKIAKIIALIDEEEAADVLLTLSKRKRERVLDLTDPVIREKIEYLVRLSKTPIGDTLSTEYLVVESDLNVSQVKARIRAGASDLNHLYYIYVVNKDKQLVGVFSLYEMLLRSNDTPVYKFMSQNLNVAYLTTPELVVLRKMVKYKLIALPVLDKNRRILGVVNFDDIIDLISNVNE